MVLKNKENKESVLVSEEAKTKAIELIASNSSCKAAMKELKSNYENFLIQSVMSMNNLQTNEITLWKQRVNKLQEENGKLSEDYINKCALINVQQEQIAGLRKQIEFAFKSEEKVNHLLTELKKYQQENKELRSTIDKLTAELAQAKLRETSLSKLLKRSSLSCKCNGTITVNELIPKLMITKENSHVSKAKPDVVIPRLDFSKLPQKKKADLKVIQCEPSNTNSIGDSSEENTKAALKLLPGEYIVFDKEEIVDAKEESESVLNSNIC